MNNRQSPQSIRLQRRIYAYPTGMSEPSPLPFRLDRLGIALPAHRRNPRRRLPKMQGAAARDYCDTVAVFAMPTWTTLENDPLFTACVTSASLLIPD